MIISIIAALDRQKVIGKNNSLPWKMPADMKHFIEVTKNKPVVMGRKTFESIGKPLKNRTNIILAHSDFAADGCITVHSIDEALNACSDHEEVMIIGGASVYEQFLPLAKRMYLTLINNYFEGDTYFPSFDMTEWKEKDREVHQKDDENPYSYAFVVMERIV